MKKFEKKLLKENNIQTGSVYRVKNKFYKWDNEKNVPVHLQADDLLTILEIKRVTGPPHGINGYIITLLYNHQIVDLKFYKSDFNILEKVC